VGQVDSHVVRKQDASPGTSQSHYAPQTPAELVSSSELDRRLRREISTAAVLCFDPTRVVHPHVAIAMPASAEEYAQRLYGALRQADAMGCGTIIIEQPPSTGGLWTAIVDRLQRATTSVR
jgi:L-threonylcarbamoyladenylate synthase